MTDWLSEIVERRKHSDIWTKTDIERMARVLREIVSYHNLTMDYVDVVKIDWARALRKAYRNLSDDAKGLLEE